MSTYTVTAALATTASSVVSPSSGWYIELFLAEGDHSQHLMRIHCVRMRTGYEDVHHHLIDIVQTGHVHNPTKTAT